LKELLLDYEEASLPQKRKKTKTKKREEGWNLALKQLAEGGL
jgi:hypothetical protein